MITLNNWAKVTETDSYIVEYDITKGKYRVSYFENNHFTDEIIFDEVKPKCPDGCWGTLNKYDV